MLEKIKEFIRDYYEDYELIGYTGEIKEQAYVERDKLIEAFIELNGDKNVWEGLGKPYEKEGIKDEYDYFWHSYNYLIDGRLDDELCFIDERLELELD